MLVKKYNSGDNESSSDNGSSSDNESSSDNHSICSMESYWGDDVDNDVEYTGCDACLDEYWNLKILPVYNFKMILGPCGHGKTSEFELTLRLCTCCFSNNKDNIIEGCDSLDARSEIIGGPCTCKELLTKASKRVND